MCAYPKMRRRGKVNFAVFSTAQQIVTSGRGQEFDSLLCLPGKGPDGITQSTNHPSIWVVSDKLDSLMSGTRKHYECVLPRKPQEGRHTPEMIWLHKISLQLPAKAPTLGKIMNKKASFWGTWGLNLHLFSSKFFLKISAHWGKKMKCLCGWKIRKWHWHIWPSLIMMHHCITISCARLERRLSTIIQYPSQDTRCLSVQVKRQCTGTHAEGTHGVEALQVCHL